jgi:hypothetical protein
MNKFSQPLKAEELALILNISEFTIKKLAKEKQLPCRIVNRRFRFDLEKIMKYFKKMEGGAA